VLLDHFLQNQVDTVTFETDLVPDSIIVDPFFTTLVDVYNPVKFSVAPFGDVPSSESDYQIPFFLDTTRSFDRINVFYRAGGSEWDSLDAEPQVDSAGYGTIRIPAQNAGTRIEYYLKFLDSEGIEYFYPPGAQAQALSFSVTSFPDVRRCLFLSFLILRGYYPHSINPFGDYYHGLIGVDLDKLEPFGTLYGVGYVSPQLDLQTDEYIVYNKFTNAVDVVDLRSWQRVKSFNLPAEFKLADDFLFPHYLSAYDTGRKKYYLMGHADICEVDLRTGIVTLLAEFSGEYGFPSGIKQIEFCPWQDRLLVKTGKIVYLINPENNVIDRELELQSRFEIPHLDSAGRLRTIEYVADIASHFPQLSFSNYRLRYKKYSLTPEFGLAYSLESAEIKGRDMDMHPRLDNGDAVSFVDGLDIVILSIMQSEGNRIIWDLSGGKDSLFVFTSFLAINRVWTWLGESGEATGIFPTSSNSTLALVDLNEKQMIERYFSPFSGERYQQPTLSLFNITGMVSFVSERSPAWDVDQDGKVDIFDLVKLIKAIRDGDSLQQENDVNKDGSVNIFDLLILLRQIAR